MTEKDKQELAHDFIAPSGVYDKQKMLTLMDSYEKGELKFMQSQKYRDQWPKHLHIIYLINYVIGEKVIYRGAYQIKRSFEEELIKNDSLAMFLMKELTKIL